MKKILTLIRQILQETGWIDAPKIQVNLIQVNFYRVIESPDQIRSLWGIPDLYQTFPDLLQKNPPMSIGK